MEKGGCRLECKDKRFKLAKLQHFLTCSGFKRPKFEIDEVEKGAHEFVGPVKVVLVTTPKREYRNKTWGAAFIILGFFLVGATSILIFFYALSWTLDAMMSLHILLFTAGFQLLTPVAFFTMNIYNGSSILLKPKHKKIDYFMLKAAAIALIIGAIICSVLSTSLRFMDHITTFKIFTAHGGIGCLAVILSVCEVITFICLPCDIKGVCPRFALVLCIPSFVLSGICFILGIRKPSFVEWLPLPVITNFLIAFCVMYTLIAIWNPFRNLSCDVENYQ